MKPYVERCESNHEGENPAWTIKSKDPRFNKVVEWKTRRIGGRKGTKKHGMTNPIEVKT